MNMLISKKIIASIILVIILITTVSPVFAANSTGTFLSSFLDIIATATVSTLKIGFTIFNTFLGTKTTSTNNKLKTTTTATTIKRTSVNPSKYNNNNSYPYSKKTGRDWTQYCNNINGYLTYIEGASEKYDVKPYLIMAIIMNESGGKRTITGYSRGVTYYGLMQISQTYYKDYLPSGKTDPLDAETNIYTGTNMFSSWKRSPYNYSEDRALSHYSGNGDNTNCEYVKKIKEYKAIIQELYTF